MANETGSSGSGRSTRIKSTTNARRRRKSTNGYQDFLDGKVPF